MTKVGNGHTAMLIPGLDRIPSQRLASAQAGAERRRTRIVCTLGPSSCRVETLHGMVVAGMDMARFNFSHGTHDFHRLAAVAVREAARQAGRPVALIQDLQGPKLRIGALAYGSVDLVEGRPVQLTSNPCIGDEETIPVPHPALVAALRPGDRVLLADGEIELCVRLAGEGCAICTVIRGGLLGERKGIAVPGRSFDLPTLTNKDMDDLRFGRTIGFDFVALSFVRSAQDVEAGKSALRRLGREVPIIAKLETVEALTNLDEILSCSDAVMVARGDLGVQLPIGQVPAAQKEIIHRANLRGVPVITATEMLQSMVTCNRPTRAEASDVANAVWDGTDAVMLSAETSAGDHPVEAVRAMTDICRSAEDSPSWYRKDPTDQPRNAQSEPWTASIRRVS